MNRLIFILCLVLGTQIVSAQIISSKQVTVRQPKKVEKPKREKYKEIEKGYRGFVEAGYSMHHGVGDILSGFDILTTHGYQFNNWVFLGGGIGIVGAQAESRYSGEIGSAFEQPIKMLFSMPAYINARFYCSRTHVKPFIDIKIGDLIPLTFDDRQWAYYSGDAYEGWSSGGGQNKQHSVTCTNSGYYASLGLGLEYKRYALGATLLGIRGNYDTFDDGSTYVRLDDPYFTIYFSVNF